MAGDNADACDVLRHLQAERRDLCGWLEQLEPAEWDADSLCRGWAVRDVIAHLTLATRETARDFTTGMIRHLGNFDRMNRVRARDAAVSFTPAELVERLRASSESDRTSFGSSFPDALVDVVVHGQDIARPLGRPRSTPPERTVVALDHALRSRWYGARKRLQHASLRCTDVDWAGGSGSHPVSGPAIDLLLVATGRPDGLTALNGDGVALLSRHLRR
jgi:uncharacterized protein (TIGR03083 family)